jgi:biopolymer transport protein ExbB
MSALQWFRLALALLLPAVALPSLALAQDASAAAGEDARDLSLREAYQREFAFLAGQKRQLEQRLEQVDRQAEQEERRLQAQLQALENELLQAEARQQTLQEQLSLAEQTAQSSVEDEQLVDVTLEQASVTLSDYDVEGPPGKEGDERAELLALRFEQAVQVLRRLSSVTKGPGTFFDKDGTKVEGQVFRVGRIAAYGVADEATGALAPAGGGKLKIWRDASGATARGLASEGSPDSLSIFLFESLDGQVDDGAGETAVEHIASGGAIAWVIMGLGAFGLLFVLIRTTLLGLAQGNTQHLEQTIEPLIRTGKYADAVACAERSRGTTAKVMASVLAVLRRGTDDVDDVVSESILRETRKLNRFGAIILVIAAVAPLLGLLGTVTGMISTFDVITKYGTGDPKMLSGGISTALVTTELGLIVAIPTLLLGNLLRGWGDAIQTDAERAVLRVLNIHKEARHGGDPSMRVAEKH